MLCMFLEGRAEGFQSRRVEATEAPCLPCCCQKRKRKTKLLVRRVSALVARRTSPLQVYGDHIVNFVHPTVPLPRLARLRGERDSNGNDVASGHRRANGAPALPSTRYGYSLAAPDRPIAP